MRLDSFRAVRKVASAVNAHTRRNQQNIEKKKNKSRDQE